jgi:hypothetical protein
VLGDDETGVVIRRAPVGIVDGMLRSAARAVHA